MCNGVILSSKVAKEKADDASASLKKSIEAERNRLIDIKLNKIRNWNKRFGWIPFLKKSEDFEFDDINDYLYVNSMGRFYAINRVLAICKANPEGDVFISENDIGYFN